MLLWRIVISVLLIPTFALLFYADLAFGVAAPLLLVLCLLLAWRCCYELTLMLQVRTLKPNFTTVSLCSCAIVLGTWWHPLSALMTGATHVEPQAVFSGTMLAFSLCVVVLMTLAAANYREPGANVENLGVELLIITYAGLLLSILAQLRWLGGPGTGYLVLGSVMVAAKGCDIGAFVFGVTLGNKPLSPSLSPLKTQWGARGGMLVSMLFVAIFYRVLAPMYDARYGEVPWSSLLLFGFVIGLAGIVGDLCESLIKRDVGCKDSAHLLPGFGGVLDMVDSVYYAAPIAYLLWLILPLGQAS